jgi:hypothetical protein
MPLRIYIAPQIGSGLMLSPDPSTWSDTTGPFRSILHSFIDVSAGHNFDEIDHPARRISICAVEASAAVLTAIEADARVTPVTYARAADRPALAAILAAPFSSYPLAWRNAARTKLESWGINTEWITGSHTMKDVLRQVIKIFSMCQVANGHGQANVKEFLKGNLDVQVSAIPAAHRQAIGAWLQSRGIDTSWITGTTTVRQVVNTLPGHFAALYGRNVGHRFAGEDF